MTPQLRFPEFTDEWLPKKFDSIFEFSTGKNIKQNEAAPNLKIPCVRYGELYHLYNEVIVDVINKTDLPVSELHFSDGSEIILPSAGEDPLDIGSASALTRRGVAIGRTINILKPKNINEYNQIFASYYINKVLKKRISQLAKGNSISNVYNSDLKKLSMRLPELAEQEKIADFLTAVDERIRLGEQKLAKLEQYKRGVMQQIFSQKIRFKDENGKPYPDWKEKAVSEFLKERKEYTSKGGDLEHISLTTAGVVPKSERYERDFLVGSTDKQYRITRLDDICYNPANLKFGVIARNKYKDGIFSPIYVTYVVNNADIGFVEYLVTGRDFIQRARKYEQGTVYERMAVSPQDLAKLKVRMPVIEEQQKIATFLTTLDARIAAEKSKLTAAKQFKKALLQRMFV